MLSGLTELMILKDLNDFVKYNDFSVKEDQLMNDDMLQFVHRNGCSFKRLFKIEPKLDDIEKLAAMLHSIFKSFLIQKKNSKNAYSFIYETLMSFNYFLELEYTSTEFKQYEESEWKKELNLIKKCSENLKRVADENNESLFSGDNLMSRLKEYERCISILEERIEKRDNHKKLLQMTKVKVGKKTDRRIVNGVLALTKYFDEMLDGQDIYFTPYISHYKLLDSHKKEKCKLNSSIVVVHIMDFLGIKNSNTENSVNKIRRTYSKQAEMGGFDIPRIDELILKSEYVLWEKLRILRENLKKSEQTEDHTDSIEKLVFYFKRSSLIKIFPEIDQIVLAQIIVENECGKKCFIDNEEFLRDVPNIIFRFQSSNEPRNC